MYLAIVGTSVRERMNDQTMADITASASGTNRKRGTPVKKNIGTNTMQMQSNVSVEEIAAFAQKRLAESHGQGVGEAIAQIQFRLVPTFAEPAVRGAGD